MNKRTSVREIVYPALLIALEVVLNRFVSINTAGWKIGFGFVPIVIAAILFGPLTAAIVGGLADFIGATLFPIGPYFPGFTVVAAAMGAVFGAFLSRKKGERKLAFIENILPPVLINSLILGLVVNTAWVSILYGSKTYAGWFLYRLPEYLILVPTECVLIPFLARFCSMIKKTIQK